MTLTFLRSRKEESVATKGKFTSLTPLAVVDYTFLAHVTFTRRASLNIGGVVLDVIVFGKVLNGCIGPEDGLCVFWI
jgi:hypothetical protein